MGYACLPEKLISLVGTICLSSFLTDNTMLRKKRNFLLPYYLVLASSRLIVLATHT